MNRRKKYLHYAIIMVVAISTMGIFVSCVIGESSFELTSPVFDHNQLIPMKYTCEGENINPPLNIEGIPEETKTLALIVDDPDAPVGTWVHWVIFNITPSNEIRENSVPGDQAYNDFSEINYDGPCPPSGTHRYFFKIYALDSEIQLITSMTKKDLEKAMQGHILKKAQLIGLYKKSL